MVSVSDQSLHSLGLCSSDDGSGSPRLRSGAPLAGCAVRRALLHRRHVHARLLPPDLSRAGAERREHPLFRQRRGCGSGGVSAVSALPAGIFTRHAGVARHIGRRVARLASHRRGRARWRRRRIARREARRHRQAPAAAVPAARRRDAARRGAHAPRALRQEAARRDHVADGRRRRGRGFWQRAALQQPDAPDIRAHADHAAAAGPPAGGRRSRRGVSRAAHLPSAVRLGSDAGVSRTACDAGCRTGRSRVLPTARLGWTDTLARSRCRMPRKDAR